MSGENIRGNKKRPDPSIRRIKAQAAYRIARGDTWEDMLKWWRRRYSHETLDLLYEVRDEAEDAGQRAQRFRQLPRDKPCGLDY